MEAQEAGTASGDVFPLELCDLCADTFPADEAVRGYVADSSSVHPTDEHHDGLRRVTACGEAHLDAIRQEYGRRPSGPSALSMTQLARRTGLHACDIRRAIAWRNERRRRMAE